MRRRRDRRDGGARGSTPRRYASDATGPTGRHDMTEADVTSAPAGMFHLEWNSGAGRVDTVEGFFWPAPPPRGATAAARLFCSTPAGREHRSRRFASRQGRAGRRRGIATRCVAKHNSLA